MLSRRTMLAASAATAGLAAEPRRLRAESPRDVVVIGKQIDDIISLDPHESFEYSAPEICNNVYQRLVAPDPDDPTVLRGDLARSWDVSEDGLTFTFHLRDDAHFATGRPVTAGDAAFSLQRAVQLDRSPAFIINQFGFTRGNVVDRITAPDATTLVLKLHDRTAPSFLLACLSATVGSVVERAEVMENADDEDMGNLWLKTASAGSGPYVVRSWRPSESVILDAVPNHPLQPLSRRVVLRHVADPATQLLMLGKGDIDVARNLLSEQLRAVAGHDGYTVSKASRPSLLYLTLNQKVPALASPQVRQALKWAIDYDAIERNLTPDKWTVHQSFLPKNFPAALDDKPFHKDPAKARALLAEAGLASGFEVTLDHSTVAPLADIAQAIQADLGEIGIKVRLIAGEQRQVITKTRARTHQLALVAWGSDYFDPHSNAEAFNVNTDNSDNARNRTLAWRSAWQDKPLSDAAIANVREPDLTRRVEVYRTMQREAQARSPFVILLQEIETAVARPGVNGFRLQATAERTDYARISKA